jgi:hypothetical protein
LRLFSRDFDALRFLSRLSRPVKICRDPSRFVETQSRFVEKSRHCQGLLSLKMIKSLDGLRNLDKKIQKSTHFLIEIETNCQEMLKIFRSQWISRSRLFGLDIDVETKSRSLDLDRYIMIVETNFFKVSRFSRHVETRFLKCRDRESRSRPRRDKSRPPGLRVSSIIFRTSFVFSVFKMTFYIRIVFENEIAKSKVESVNSVKHL